MIIFFLFDFIRLLTLFLFVLCLTDDLLRSRWRRRGRQLHLDGVSPDHRNRQLYQPNRPHPHGERLQIFSECLDLKVSTSPKINNFDVICTAACVWVGFSFMFIKFSASADYCTPFTAVKCLRQRSLTAQVIIKYLVLALNFPSANGRWRTNNPKKKSLNIIRSVCALFPSPSLPSPFFLLNSVKCSSSFSFLILFQRLVPAITFVATEPLCWRGLTDRPN